MESLSRPYGTGRLVRLFPAINRRAIFNLSLTGRRDDLNDATFDLSLTERRGDLNDVVFDLSLTGRRDDLGDALKASKSFSTKPQEEKAKGCRAS